MSSALLFVLQLCEPLFKGLHHAPEIAITLLLLLVVLLLLLVLLLLVLLLVPSLPLLVPETSSLAVDSWPET